MESQMLRPHGQTYDQDPYQTRDTHLAMEGEDENHHEKKSVLKKVKAKAKKIKDTITKHGHGHNHDHGDHIPDDHDLDEEDDEDDEMIKDPEVHGAPIYESTTVTMGATPANTPVLPSFSDHGVSDTTRDPSEILVPSRESTNTKVNLDMPTGLEKDPHAPRSNPRGHSTAASNNQTKVPDPSGKGAEEIGVTPILRSFDKMNLGEPKSHTEAAIGSGSSFTGSHDQFSPETVPQPTSYTDKISAATSAIAEKAVSAKNAVASKIGYGKPASGSAGLDGSEAGFSVEPLAHQHTDDAVKPPSYTEKISSATSAIADKAKNTVASTLGYGHESADVAATDNAVKPESYTYTDKISAATSAVAEKAVSAKNAVASKLGYGVVHESPAGAAAQDRGVSVKGYLAEKLRPAEEDKALSEAISDALQSPRRRRREAAPIERVTQSVEVTRRLGEDERSEKSEGNSYVDKVKDTVGAWLGVGSTLDRYKASQGERRDDLQGKTDEPRLQESSN